MHAHQAVWQKCLWDLIDSQLNIVDSPPLPAWSDHTAEAISHTLLRDADHVRAVCPSPSHPFLDTAREPTGARSAARLEARSRVCRFLNGDLRRRGLFHQEAGCCPNGPEQTKLALHAAIVGAGLLLTNEETHVP